MSAQKNSPKKVLPILFFHNFNEELSELVYELSELVCASHFFSLYLSNDFGAIFIDNERMNNGHYKKPIISFIYHYPSSNGVRK